MDTIQTLIVGAGVSGLATAAALGDREYLILEADGEIGGYCKTVRQDGFVWDYSGHFFHFKHPEIERWLCDRMPGQRIRRVLKRSFIRYKGRDVDFPFQKNIHQLPQEEFIDCLHDLYFAQTEGGASREHNSFKEMLFGRFGRAIAEKFLIPYNEKLYACDLAALDKDAMGRFFPTANLTDIVRNMRTPDNSSYNATFTYPEGGAIEYVKAIASAVRPEAIAFNERLVSVDLEARVARTTQREIGFERLVSSAPSTSSSPCAASTTTPRSSRGTRSWSSTSASTARDPKTSTGPTTPTARRRSTAWASTTTSSTATDSASTSSWAIPRARRSTPTRCSRACSPTSSAKASPTDTRSSRSTPS